ncbi:MAG: DUF6538 domain-containing protein [Hydrogenophaga sp.]|uniref:DUF6538 domain-containing protein n=1 Tax=Hydrogenophaga sp. TaxID=1904254 RepID=UPI003D100EFF
MKSITESIYERGKHGTKYLRVRIPKSVRPAYPTHCTHVTLSLGTTDLKAAKILARSHRAKLDTEFERVRQQIADRQADLYARQLGASEVSNERAGGDAVAVFHAIANQAPTGGASTLGGDRGSWSGEFLSRLDEHIKRLGVDQVLSCLEAYSALRPTSELGNQMVPSVVPSVVIGQLPGAQLKAQGPAEARNGPQEPRKPAGEGKALPGWDEVFAAWRDFVPDRPRSTAIASQTPWRDLQRFKGQRVACQECKSPAEVTAEDMTAFAQDMRGRGLAVDTINERLSKIKAIYKIAVGRHMLAENPAQDTLGFKESSVQKRKKRRLPFDQDDLRTIFGSEVFTDHRRSSGQSGEASYWIPILMFYTGARPEEVAGLSIQDIKQDPEHGWYLDLIDRPSGEDLDLFEEVPKGHRRTLKNGHSIRRVPVAQQLIDLGLLRYVDWLRGQGHTVLFPTLQKDWHGKLSGAFSKFFGRYLRALGVKDERKVMYSFRHTMKDLLEQARMPTKYLQRFLGHTSGDGTVTDGYGSDVPFEILVDYFMGVRFPQVPAKPWQQGRGKVRLIRAREDA